MKLKKDTISVIKIILPIVLGGFLVGIGELVASSGNRIAAYKYFVFAIIIALGYPAMLISDNVNKKLDERFDQLERLLKNKQEIINKKNETKEGSNKSIE